MHHQMSHGQFCYARAEEAQGLVAVVATLSKGYDLDYIWKQVDRGPAKDAASYYIQASESGGEPPGRWWGPGARALGFEPGQRSSASHTICCSASAKPPTAPSWAGPRATAAKAADLYAELLAAEPHATAERQRELRTEAVKKARQRPLFFDLTLSLSKSISIFHASLGENARLARQAGDDDGDAYWSALVTEVDDMIWQAVHAGFAYFQREAGYTRTGSHNTRVHGRETGQWHEADLAVAHWLQHTSRDGDMQLHVHSQIAHTARTGTDGKWRAPDSLGYNEHIGAVAAIVSQHLEEALTARFGLEWAARDDGHGFEIKGITGEMMRVFSSRRASITADLRGRAARFEQQYDRKPSQRELAQLAQASNFATRAAKEGALDFAQLHAGWADKLARTLGALTGVGRAVGLVRRRAAARARTRAARTHLVPFPPSCELARAAQKAIALAQQEKSTWTRADVIKYLGRVLPRTGLDPAAAAAPAGGPGRPGAAVGVRASHLPGSTRAGRRLRAACCARTGAASTSGTAAPGTRRARSWSWKNACSRKPARMARRAWPARKPRTRSARTRTRLEDALTGRAHDARRRAGCAHGQRAARGPGRRRVGRTDRWQARVGAQRPGRVRQDPRAGRGRADLGRHRTGPGHRHHPVPVGPQHPGRRGAGVLQRRPVPGSPPGPPRCPRPGLDRPGHTAGDR